MILLLESYKDLSISYTKILIKIENQKKVSNIKWNIWFNTIFIVNSELIIVSKVFRESHHLKSIKIFK